MVILTLDGSLVLASENARLTIDQAVSSEYRGNEYAFVYTDNFAQMYGLSSDNLVELPEGVSAIRAYKSYHKHAVHTGLQFYLSKDVVPDLSEGQRTSIAYDTSYTGFLGFHGKGLQRQFMNEEYEEEEKERNKLGWRLIIGNPVEGFHSSSIYRYNKTLIPGLVLIEAGTVFFNSNQVWIHNGRTKPTAAQFNRAVSRINESDGSVELEHYFKVPLPKKITDFMKNNCNDMCEFVL